jgi:hypothetical protein
MNNAHVNYRYKFFFIHNIRDHRIKNVDAVSYMLIYSVRIWAVIYAISNFDSYSAVS